MKSITTVTLNPAFDLHYYMESLELGKENYVQSIQCDAGGKGINISRALTVNGVQNTAFAVIGEENGASFEAALQRDGIVCVPFYTPGRIRENITLHPGKDRETRISLDTFRVRTELLESVEQELNRHCRPGDLLAFAGRNPRGLGKPEVLGMLGRLISAGVRLAVDSNSFTPEDLRLLRPWLIKPNEQEIASFLGSPVRTPAEAAQAAAELVRQGVAEQVMISLGGEGAVWSDGARRFALTVPRLEHPVSTIGAGDSTIAGFLAASAQGQPLPEVLRQAVAFGTAACMTPGTQPPRPEDVAGVLAGVRVAAI